MTTPTFVALAMLAAVLFLAWVQWTKGDGDSFAPEIIIVVVTTVLFLTLRREDIT